MHPTRRLLLTLAATASLLYAAPSMAQSPLTIIVPTPAGSAPDLIARTLGDELRQRLGQPVIVENRSGAGGIIATMAAKPAPAVGNTLLLSQAAAAVVTPLTYRAAKYDMQRDFETIAVVAQTPMLIVTSASSSIKTLAQLITQAKAKPDSLTMSSPARGSVPHLGGELLEILSGAALNTVPMRDSPQALQAVASGDSQVSIDAIAPLWPLVKSGRLQALAVTADKPVPGMESLPLAKDTVPGLTVSGWFMLFAPKGTPQARVDSLNAAVNDALKSPALIQKFQTQANFPVGGSVSAAQDFLAREKKLWASVAQRAGLKPE